jgi:hypothetical protein
MAETFDSALAPFRVHLDEVRNCVAFIRNSIRLKSSLGKIVDWRLGKTHEILLADSFIKLEDLQLRPVLNGLFVTVIAAFEEFLRTIIMLAVRQKVENVKVFHELGQSFIKRHMEYSGKLLAMVNSPPAHLSLDYYDLCRRIGTCLPSSTNIEMNDIAFGFIRGLTEIETFIDCIKEIGYQLELDDFGRNRELQNLLHTRKTRETSNELRRVIHEAVSNRHKIAHSGQSHAEISEEVFTYQLSLLELTAISIVIHLNKQLIVKGQR